MFHVLAIHLALQHVRIQQAVYWAGRQKQKLLRRLVTYILDERQPLRRAGPQMHRTSGLVSVVSPAVLKDVFSGLRGQRRVGL